MPTVSLEPKDLAAAAAMVGLQLDPADVPAITRHLEMLLRYAEALGETDDEPAPVFRA